MIMAVIPKDAIRKELDLEDAENIETIDFSLHEKTLKEIETHCDKNDIIIDANLYMFLAGLEFRSIYDTKRPKNNPV